MNTIPIYEAKNKLPLFMHMAEESGPVFISRHNHTVGVLISYEEYNRIITANRKSSFLEKAEDFRKKIAGRISDSELENIFNVRDCTPDNYETHTFDGVFEK